MSKRELTKWQKRVIAIEERGRKAGYKLGYETGRDHGLTQGVAYAVAEMYRHGNEESIWKSWGMPTLEECVRLGVSEYDMEILNEHQKELEK